MGKAIAGNINFKKILVVKPSALGDIVHSLPFLASLRDHFPWAEVHWVVARGLNEFLEGHPMITRLWVIDKDRWKRIRGLADTASELRALVRGLRAEGFDLAVDLQGLLRSGLIAAASGAPVRIGFREAREGSTLFYTHRVAAGGVLHAIERYLLIASSLGCRTGAPEYPFPPLPPLSETGLGLPAEYAVMAPSAGKEANRWPAHRFGELASMLPVSSVFISGRSDAPLAEEAAGASRGKAVSLAGRTTLREAAAVIRGAKFFVSNDTGPMHIAAAFNVPVFALFGPANSARTGPYGPIHTVISERLACSPCYRKKRCGNWVCMERITVERVYGEICARMRWGADNLI